MPDRDAEGVLRGANWEQNAGLFPSFEGCEERPEMCRLCGKLIRNHFGGVELEWFDGAPAIVWAEWEPRTIKQGR